MMSKKDCEQVAAVVGVEVRNVAILKVGSEIRRSAQESVQNIAVGLANTFAANNQRFDRARFLRACGLVEDRDFGWKVPVTLAQHVRHIYDNSPIVCKGCGHDKFYSMGRSLDYNNWQCASCGNQSSTLTETGASR